MTAMLMLGACGGGASSGGAKGGSGAAPSGDDPCKLVTQGEVESVIGTKVGEGKRPEGPVSSILADLPGVNGCRFTNLSSAGGGAQAQPGGPSVVFDIGLTTTFASDVFRKYETGPFAGQLVPVPGLGDKALWRDSGRRLVVLKGDKVLALGLFIGIDVAGKDPATIDPKTVDNPARDRDFLTKLAQKAVQRL